MGYEAHRTEGTEAAESVVWSALGDIVVGISARCVETIVNGPAAPGVPPEHCFDVASLLHIELKVPEAARMMLVVGVMDAPYGALLGPRLSVESTKFDAMRAIPTFIAPLRERAALRGVTSTEAGYRFLLDPGLLAGLAGRVPRVSNGR
jgi:hypothetical protein